LVEMTKKKGELRRTPVANRPRKKVVRASLLNRSGKEKGRSVFNSMYKEEKKEQNRKKRRKGVWVVLERKTAVAIGRRLLLDEAKEKRRRAGP